MSQLSAWRRGWFVLLAALLAGLVAVPRLQAAAGESPGCPPPITCLAQLRCLGLEELQQVFAAAHGCSVPAGCGRGECLLRTDAKHADRKVRMTNRFWKGKCFAEDGYFTNQWAGFRALHSYACQGPSWLDGRPCVILEYPPHTPLFGNARDEIREVAPGLWLGMWYDREPCPKLRGFFALECQPEKDKKLHR
jgi:hypothetical protein